MVRTRFAPSPTGALHLGNVRTAVFAWAYARRHHGQFILRIEDTDLERSSEESSQGILRDMAWLGLDFDEGPYYQMQRMSRYREIAQQLLQEGYAYRCYASPGELEQLRAEQMARGEKPRYDGRWRPENIRAGTQPPADVQPVLRFKNPVDGIVAWEDAVKGRIEIANAELDDLIILRSDGTPTYNFCVVVDDIDMRISHVIRGDDHVNNTPRQINLFLALRSNLPVFAHTSTVLGPDGERLSKRHGATSLLQYAERGYLPETMLNYLARLGWAHGDDEVFIPAQLIEWFDLSHISPSPARFNPEKLAWLNQQHMKRADPVRLGKLLKPFLEKRGYQSDDGPDATKVVELFRERAHTLDEVADAADYLYAYHPPSDELVASHVDKISLRAIAELIDQMAMLDWNRQSIAAKLKEIAARHQLKIPQIMMPLRVLITGTTNTPSMDAILEVLGRNEARRRLQQSVNHLR